MQYSAVQISHYIINLCKNKSTPVFNSELQKILYFIQIYYIKNHNGNPLFMDDFYAWSCGPVIPKIYYLYSGYGGSTLCSNYDVSDINISDKNEIENIVLRLKNTGVWKLVEMAKRKDCPWDLTYQKGMNRQSIIDKKILSFDTNSI